MQSSGYLALAPSYMLLPRLPFTVSVGWRAATESSTHDVKRPTFSQLPSLIKVDNTPENALENSTTQQDSGHARLREPQHVQVCPSAVLSLAFGGLIGLLHFNYSTYVLEFFAARICLSLKLAGSTLAGVFLPQPLKF